MPDSNLPIAESKLPAVVVADTGPIEARRGNVCHTMAWKTAAALAPVPMDFEEMATDADDISDQAEDGDSQELIKAKAELRTAKAVLRANKKAARDMHARQHHYYEARRLPDGSWQVRSVSAVHQYDLKSLDLPTFGQDLIYNYQVEGDKPLTFAEAMQKLYGYQSNLPPGVESFDPKDEQRSPSVYFKDFLEREDMIQDRTGLPFRKMDVLVDRGIGLFTETQLKALQDWALTNGIRRPVEQTTKAPGPGTAVAVIPDAPATGQALVLSDVAEGFKRIKIGDWFFHKMYRGRAAKKFVKGRPHYSSESEDLEHAIRNAGPHVIIGILEQYEDAKLSDDHWIAAASRDLSTLDLLLDFAQKNPASVAKNPDAGVGQYLVAHKLDDALALVLKTHGERIVTGKTDRGEPLLAYAVRQKNEKASDLLLKNGATLDWRDPEAGDSLFMIAAAFGNDPVVNYAAYHLNNVDIDEQRDSDKKTALMLAVINGHETTAHILFEAGARIDLMDVDGMLVTHHAALKGNINFLKACARKSPGIMEKADWQLCTPLLSVASFNTLEARKTVHAMIIDAEIASKVTHIDADGRSILALAAKHGWDDVIEAALKHGADPNKGAIDGKSPLMLAIEANNPTSAMKLIEGERLEADGSDGKGADLSLPVDGEGNTVLHALAIKGMDMMLPTILRHLGDSPIVNQTNAKGMTPLLTAAAAGHWNFVNKLFDKGVVSDESGATLAHYAMRAKRKDVLAKYFARMPNFDYAAKGTLDGKTLMQLAIDSDEPELLRLIPDFKKGIDARAPENGETALSYALKNGKAKAAAFLIKEAGASLTQTNIRFEMPFELMIQSAAKNGDLALFTLLPDTRALAQKIDLNGEKTDVAIIDRIGMNRETPLTTAIKAKQTDLANWLIHAGASVKAANLALETPFALVMANGMEDLLGHFLGNDFDTSTALVESESILFHLGNLSDGKFRDFVRDFRTPDVRNKAGDMLVTTMLAAAPKDRAPQRLAMLLEEVIGLAERGRAGDAAAQKRAEAWVRVMNTPDANGDLPIHQVLSFKPDCLTRKIGTTGETKDKNLLELMVMAGADPNGHNAAGKTPLVVTIEKGWQVDFKALLAVPGVDPEAPTAQGDTPLMIAAAKIGPDEQDAGFASELLERLADKTDFTRTNAKGQTSAHIVSSNTGASWTLLTHFIPKDAMDQADNDGNSILLCNLKTGRSTSSIELLKHSADPTLTNKAGENAFSIAFANAANAEGQSAVLDVLFESATQVMRQGNVEQQKRLQALLSDTGPNGIVPRVFKYAEQNPQHASKLFTALTQVNGSRSGTQFRLDANMRLADGRSLLCAALESPQERFRTDAVAALLQAGVDVDQPVRASEPNGDRPVGLALKIDPDLVSGILTKSQDKNWQDADGRTILARAILASQSDKLHQAILDLGVSPDIADKDGNTALHHAIARNLPGTMVMLFEAGADVTLRNKMGYTPTESIYRHQGEGMDTMPLEETLYRYCIAKNQNQQPVNPALFDTTALDDEKRKHGLPLLHALLFSELQTLFDTGLIGIMSGADTLVKDSDGDTILTKAIGCVYGAGKAEQASVARDVGDAIAHIFECMLDPAQRQALAATPGKDGKTPYELAAQFKPLADVIAHYAPQPATITATSLRPGPQKPKRSPNPG